MVLASDGIWNVKSCQKVIDFLRPKVLKGDGKLSSCIEEVSIDKTIFTKYASDLLKK